VQTRLKFPHKPGERLHSDGLRHSSKPTSIECQLVSSTKKVHNVSSSSSIAALVCNSCHLMLISYNDKKLPQAALYCCSCQCSLALCHQQPSQTTVKMSGNLHCMNGRISWLHQNHKWTATVVY